MNWGVLQAVTCDWSPPFALVGAGLLFVGVLRGDRQGTARLLAVCWLLLAMPLVNLLGPHHAVPLGWVWYISAVSVAVATVGVLVALTVAGRHGRAVR